MKNYTHNNRNIAYININSEKNRFDLLVYRSNGNIDVLMISEKEKMACMLLLQSTPHLYLGSFEQYCNQFEEEPEIVTDEDENRKITAAEALKKLDEVKNFIEVNGSNHLNMIFNESIENVEQMKLKNKKQSDIRSFFRS